MALDVQISNQIHDLKQRVVDLQAGKVTTHPDVVELVEAVERLPIWSAEMRKSVQGQRVHKALASCGFKLAH